MVGGRKEGDFTINNSNVFAALDTLRKKKIKDKKGGSSKSSSKSATVKAKDPEPQVLMPTRLNASTAWGDIDSEEEDDFYATEAPLTSTWGATASLPGKEPALPAEESESEEDMLDLGDEEVEDDHEHESEAPIHPEPAVTKAPEIPAAPKETERQLSKKERKKKELEELEALLADFGVKNGNGEGAFQEKKPEEQKKEDTDNGEKKDAVLTESKSAKKKKKKEKSTKENRDQASFEGPAEPTESSAGTDQAEDATSGDMKERLKKMAAAKKKKSSKEMDAAAKAAAVEAAARNARLAAAKKKEKNHYNQQPVR